MTIFEVEDFLQDHQVFRNGLDLSKTSDPGSYMSVLDFATFDACREELMARFTVEQLVEAGTYFRDTVGYLSPTLKLTGLSILRLFHISTVLA